MSRPHVTWLAVGLLAGTLLSGAAHAQQGLQRFECAGNVTGVPSEALLEISPGGLYTEGWGVAGNIRNQFAEYQFNGILYGGSEGFVSLVELHTGARIDRVWIGLGRAGKRCPPARRD